MYHGRRSPIDHLALPSYSHLEIHIMKSITRILLGVLLVSPLQANDGLPGKVLIPLGSGEWKYHAAAEALPESWPRLDFDDSSWKTGTAPLGYGEDDIATTISFGPDKNAKFPVAWFRKRCTITADARAGLTDFAGRVRLDDGGIVYLNGQEVFRANKSAASSTWADETLSVEGEHVLFEIPADSVVAGENVLAVSVHQANAKSSDLVMDLELRGLGPAAGGSSLDTLKAALAVVQDVGAAAQRIYEFEQWLACDETSRENLAEFAAVGKALSKGASTKARDLLIDSRARMIRAQRAAEMEARTLRLGKHTMPFYYRICGEKPATGRSLFISMHGGGNTAKRVNDSQWNNQKRLYEPKEGIYLAPRAPTDTWNLWHQSHIDRFFDRLVENLVVLEDVDPDRVYIMGYSAGGDGVYQLAPRMADRWAAAAMMAGHPNETKPFGLRNIGFTLHVGGRDTAYRRNEIGAEWKKKLAALREADPAGYRHDVQVHPGKPHWMDREDRVAVPWMAEFTRDPIPERIVWYQDDVAHERFYWLALPAGEAKRGQHIVATRSGQKIELEKTDGCERLIIRLNDEMLDMDKRVEVVAGGRRLFRGKVTRNLDTMVRTLAERGDPRSVYCAEIEVELSR